MGNLDSFLKEHSLFLTGSSSSRRKEELKWKEFAPTVDNYNSVLAKAIAGGTGKIVKGIFTCSNAYTNMVSSNNSVHVWYILQMNMLKPSCLKA